MRHLRFVKKDRTQISLKHDANAVYDLLAQVNAAGGRYLEGQKERELTGVAKLLVLRFHMVF